MSARTSARTIFALAAGWATALSVAAPALAVGSFTLTDGSATFTLNNLQSSRTGSNNGEGTFTTGVPATNHMFQNWFWISAGHTDTREYALSNQTNAVQPASNVQFLEYVEAANNGVTPNAIRVRLTYTLTDLSTAPGRSDEALLVISFQLTNLLPTSLSDIAIYHYVDFDAAGSGSGDSAVVRGASNQLQVISDPGNATSPAVRIDYAASGDNRNAFQIGAYPSVRNRFTDGLLSGLTDGGSPMPAGDYTGANQWYPLIGLTALGTNGDTINGSVTIHVTTRCKADFNESGTLEVQDIFDYLSAWFAGCP